MAPAKKPPPPRDKPPKGKGKPNLGALRTKANAKLPLKQVRAAVEPFGTLAVEAIRRLSPPDGDILRKHLPEVLDAIQHAAATSPRVHAAIASAKAAGVWSPAITVAIKIVGEMWAVRAAARVDPAHKPTGVEDAGESPAGSQGLPRSHPMPQVFDPQLAQPRG